MNLDEVKRMYIKSLLIDYNTCNEHAIEHLVDETGLSYSDSEQFLLWWFRENDVLNKVNKKMFFLNLKVCTRYFPDLTQYDTR